MSAVAANRADAMNRLDRRKARTRRSLVDAAVTLITEGRAETASVQEITDVADVGLGSFYNHFESKEQLFHVASAEVLERWASLLDEACTGVEDPAQVFAISLRMSGRLAWTNPTIAGFIIGAGLALLESPGGLAPRALRDIRAAKEVGRFTVPDAEIALSAIGGGLIGLLQLQHRLPEIVGTDSVDALTEGCLRLLGIDEAEAHRLARLPLPDKVA
jgi:AcrR family transcriptional regulator